MKLKFNIWLLILLISFPSTSFNQINRHNEKRKLKLGLTDYSYLRDTVFTVKNYFIEVNLKTQKGYLHSRSGEVKEFDVSTGTVWVKDGIQTKEGLFVIKSKKTSWYSQQFDSTLMLNWMGFNFGIGFHALPSSGYYRYLGIKRTSHGCIRISRRIAKYLYQILDLGTPVLVHSENNILKVAFTKSNQNYDKINYHNLHKLLAKVFESLYAGRYFLQKKRNLVIDDFNVYHSGLPIGEASKILKRQITKPIYRFIDVAIPDNKSLMLIGKNIQPGATKD